MSGADPSHLLNQLEHILESDPLIDEIGFIHPSQFAALSVEARSNICRQEEATAAPKVSEANSSDKVFWNRDHKLGISTAVLFMLYNAAKHAFMVTFKQYMMVKEEDHEGNALPTSEKSSFSLNSLESALMKHSRALLLLSCDYGTAWNCRKQIVSKEQHSAMLMDELHLSTQVLSYSPKSERAWSHRRWVIKMIAGKCSHLQEIVERESELVKRLAENSPKWTNELFDLLLTELHQFGCKFLSKKGVVEVEYICNCQNFIPYSRTNNIAKEFDPLLLQYALHLSDGISTQLVDDDIILPSVAEIKNELSCMESPLLVLQELSKSRDWAGLHVADSSCFHYIARLMLQMLEDSRHCKDPDSSSAADLHQAWQEQLDWLEMLIKRYIGREALWLHRRFLSLCWIKHFANVGIYISGSSSHECGLTRDIDGFIAKELQIFESCTIIPDDEFQDYQAQATHAATYILWIAKQIPDSLRPEFQKKLEAGRLKVLLNNVCPEKSVIWDSLIALCENM